MKLLKHTGRKCFLLLVLYSLLLPFSVAAQVVLTDSTHSLSTSIYGHVSVLIPNRELSLEQATHDNSFVPLQLRKSGVPNFGVEKHSIWLRFKIINKCVSLPAFTVSVGNPSLWKASMYLLSDESRVIDSIAGGNRLPFGFRKLNTPEFVFPLILPQDKEVTVYLNIKSNLPLSLPLSINKPSVQFESSAFQNGVMLAFIGILLVMVFYNSFVALSTNDKVYLYYIVYLILLGLSQLSIHGYGYMYLWPNSPLFNRDSPIILACLCAMSIILFSIKYLGVDRKRDKYYYITFCILFTSLCTSIILELFALWQPAFFIMQITTLVGGFALIIISVLMTRYNKSAWFFIYAWSALIAFNTVFVLKDYGVFPTNRFTSQSVLIGSVIEIVILSLGLANRINILKQERERARFEALKLAHENEQLLSEQNAILEKEVLKRTQELENKNTTLNATLVQLKETQSQLVAAEKMSSLGQLTAGIAHEINNPINFVSANISPLKRDVKQLFDTINKIESIGFEEGKAAATKLLEMAAYKEQQELDELQEEIDLLLNGIQDGASRTADIVRGLRLFSRLDEDTWKEADLNKGLKSTLAIASNILKGIKVEAQWGDIPLVTCFPGKLNQVFLNIITNAVFAIRQQHGENIGGKLSLKTWQEAEFVFVSIKDDGIGMDQETLSKLYDPFFTTKPVGEGTGLGMSIVFTIVEQHYARLTVWSEPGKGTEFTLRFYIQPPVEHGEALK